MSAAKSTPTPWAPEPEPKPHGFGVVDANGRTVCRIPLRLTSPLPPTEELCAQAQWIEQRIVQCVNAHDELVALLREGELFLRRLGLDSAPAASLAADMRAALAKAGSDGMPSVVEATATPSSPSAKAGSAE